uniref:NADH-ubiquinone oxidoreductase chain 2 n=1 Tax=Soliperla sp. ZTC-2018 TaxID=2267274 RepID=A0A344KZ48_9NEOP|nr:NADH dehydrogenase subunit 2 [Soliperla sp. ZTC-2018]AXB38830.1 NADH dehydrogenase subunit 2 [Soliperla sp. ZTC-2018]
MLNNPTKLLFLMTLMSGTLISISANSWFGAWIGLEINLLSFIPMMTNSNNLLSTEASLKYFLTQALASATLLFTVILSSLLYSSPNSLLMTNSIIITLINTSLLLKMGAAPLHFWFPGVMEGLNWMNGLMLMTWQKIAPLILLSYNLTMNMFTSVIIILSVIIGSIGGLNQTSLRKILAYSSINHLGWLITALIMGESLWNLYFLTYVYLTSTIIFMLNSLKLFHVNQIFSMNFTPPVIKFSLFMALLSLGGLPPFIGFLPKWMIIQAMTSAQFHLIISLMVIMTLVTLFYYLRTSFGAFMLTYTETIWGSSSPKINTNQIMALTLSMISTLGLIFSSTLFSIL